MTSSANETPASHSPPAVLSAAQRHDLARQFALAKQLAGKSPPHFAGVHRVLSGCCTLDPGNTLFLAALLENLDRAQGKIKAKWFWQVWNLERSLIQALRERRWTDALVCGWTLVGERPREALHFVRLAEVFEALDHRQTELVLLKRATQLAPGNMFFLNRYTQACAEAGQLATVQSVRPEYPAPLEGIARTTPAAVANLIPRIEQIIADGKWDLAERVLTAEGGALGASFRLRELGEELTLGRARERTRLAQQLAATSPTPRAQELVGELLEEQRRIELGVAFARYERLPSEPACALELASCLTRVKNYSEALKYLSPLTSQEKWRLPALLASAENWQHLRQFERAMQAYRDALEASDLDPQNEHVQRGWYRGAVLAEASRQPEPAIAWLERLTAANSAYKDAAARLDNLRAICNKGGFSAHGADAARGA